MSFVASTNKYVQILHFHGTSFLQPIMFDPSGSVTCLPLKANALTLQHVTAKSHIFSHSILEAIMRLRHSCARSQASFFFRSVPSIYKFCYALVDKGIALTSMMWIPRGDPCFTFSLYSRRLNQCVNKRFCRELYVLVTLPFLIYYHLRVQSDNEFQARCQSFNCHIEQCSETIAYRRRTRW